MPEVVAHPITSPRGSDGKFAKSPVFAVAGESDVIKWDDRKSGPSFERADEMTVAPGPGSEDETPAETPAAKSKTTKVAPAKVETEEAPAEGEAEAEEEAPVDEAVARRAKIKAAIEAQKSKLSLETATKAEKERADKAEAELERLRKAPLNELFKFRGVTKQEVEDKLLIGADDVDTGDAKPQGGGDLTPRERALLERVEKLEGRVETVQSREQNETLRAAVSHVKDSLAQADVRAIRVTPDGYNRVLVTAHSAWMASGKAGQPGDYLADAAGIVEEELRVEMAETDHGRDLLRLIDAAPATNGAEAEEEPPPAKVPPKKPAPRVAVGRRVAATTTAKPAPLPMDADARDKAIKDSMFPGWRS